MTWFAVQARAVVELADTLCRVLGSQGNKLLDEWANFIPTSNLNGAQPDNGSHAQG